MRDEKDNSTKNRYFNCSFVVAVASCAAISGCATYKSIVQNSSGQTSAQLSLDLVSKLVKFAQLDESSPAEKFELYFETKVQQYLHPETNKLMVFKGADPKTGISIAGASDVDASNPTSKQTANIRLPRASECIPPGLMLSKLPQLERSLERGPAIADDDDPVKVVFYRAYSIHNKYGYVSYRFEGDKCLREVGVSQKTINP